MPNSTMHPPKLSGWFHFAGKKVLLLQGPHGPFFKRVKTELLASGAAKVNKVNFNGGDWLYFPQESLAYTGSFADWPAYLARLMDEEHFDCVMVFGDCRPIHTAARAVVKDRGAEFWVFEEGYVRPNFITLEQHGVNGHSYLPSHRETYDDWQLETLATENNVPKSFGAAAQYAMAYFTASMLMWPKFRQYKHHRSLSILDGLKWVRSFVRKQIYASKEAQSLTDLQPAGRRPYFLVILQVASDAQVAVHSSYASISEFITETVLSFSQYVASSGEDVVLVIKHHPMDRGYSDYSRLIADLEAQHKLAGRLRYIHDQYLPELLGNALGVVTINSTVGLSALDHGTPVIALGEAVYNMQGLTCQDDLSAFWENPNQYVADPDLHEKFHNYVILHTQINGNFYAALPGSDAKGLPWQPSAHSAPATSAKALQA
jgi:capsular polysaccharide export protein